MGTGPRRSHCALRNTVKIKHNNKNTACNGELKIEARTIARTSSVGNLRPSIIRGSNFPMRSMKRGVREKGRSTARRKQKGRRKREETCVWFILEKEKEKSYILQREESYSSSLLPLRDNNCYQYYSRMRHTRWHNLVNFATRHLEPNRAENTDENMRRSLLRAFPLTNVDPHQSPPLTFNGVSLGASETTTGRLHVYVYMIVRVCVCACVCVFLCVCVYASKKENIKKKDPPKLSSAAG